MPQSILQLRRWDPQRIGPYAIIGRLGAGSMGQVFLARSAAGRLVAVKTIRVELAEEPGFRARFAREVAAARRVSGAFTAPVIEADPEADLPWVATAYVPAPTLSTLVLECGPLPAPAVRWLAVGCAEALQSIHGAGLLHRDVKPANVLVAPDGPRMIDFGVARAIERVELTSRYVGTPAYMAPEQARDLSTASSASDIFSLGATLLFAATGHPPYHGETVMDVLVRLATEPPDLTGLQDELTDLVASCLSRVPRDRPTNAAILRQLDPSAFPAGIGQPFLPDSAMAMIAGYQKGPASITQGRPATAWAEGTVDPIPSVPGAGRAPDESVPPPGTAPPGPEAPAASRGVDRTVWVRWLVAVLGALAAYFGCWGGLAAGHVLDTGTDVGIAVVPLSVTLVALGAWAARAPGTARHRDYAPREPGEAAARPVVPVPDSDGAGTGNGSGSGSGGHHSPGSGGLDSGGEYGEDGARSRFLTGVLPERAPTGDWIDLRVQVTLAATGMPSAKWARLAPLPVNSSGTTLKVTVDAPGLKPRGDLEQDLRIPLNADSRQITFGFVADRTGLHRVGVRAFLDGTCLGELAFQISVENRVALEEGRPRVVPMARLAAEPGEVTLQVSRTVSGGYSFQLLSEAFYPLVLVDRLAGDPAAVVGQMIAELRALSAGQPRFGSPALVRKRLRNLGAKLWADVVPDAIREQFWAQRDRIGLFTIASDLDTVPWELLYPVDKDNEDGFLVEQFPVVRRVYGQSRARVLRLDDGAGFIVPPRSPADAMDEVAAVRGILPPHVVHRGTKAGLAEVQELLDAVPSVLHFAGHSTFTDEIGSLINLEGGPLRPEDICYARQKRAFADVSPLVFFNGCRTAGEIPGITQTNGWAREFMGAGAAAFIGSLWAVRSDSARMFAEEFYRALVRDQQPLGAASLRARRAIAADESDPTWLAYTVYGNPSASVENNLPMLTVAGTYP